MFQLSLEKEKEKKKEEKLGGHLITFPRHKEKRKKRREKLELRVSKRTEKPIKPEKNN